MPASFNNDIKQTCYYTLLEMVVALAILATVITIAGMSLVTVQQTWKKSHAVSGRLENLLKLDRLIDISFRNIIPFTWTDPDTKKDKSVFVGNPDTITFATRHRITKTDFSTIRFIHIFLEDGSLVVEYAKTPVLKDITPDNMKREVIADNIENISFKYADINSSGKIEWLDDWDEDPLSNKNIIPMAVQIKIVWNDGRQEQWLRRTAGSGRYESFGKRKKLIK